MFPQGLKTQAFQQNSLESMYDFTLGNLVCISSWLGSRYTVRQITGLNLLSQD